MEFAQRSLLEVVDVLVRCALGETQAKKELSTAPSAQPSGGPGSPPPFCLSPGGASAWGLQGGGLGQDAAGCQAGAAAANAAIQPQDKKAH